jgi:stress-induced morphogen
MSNAKPKPRKTARRRSPARGPIDLKERLRAALRDHFKHDTVDITDGYKGNVHILIVSREFDGKGDYERQAMLHRIIDNAGLTKSQFSKISLLLALSPGEIK